MSAEAVGWVFRFSPYNGERLVLHLALADVANDAYENRLWLSVETLSDKTRSHRRTVQRGLRVMVDDGLLELVESGGGRGKPAVYRLVLDPQKGRHADALSPERVAPGSVKGGAEYLPPFVNPKEPNSADSPSEGPSAPSIEADFDAAWSLYPRKDGRKAALRAYTARRSAGASPEELLRATGHFARAMVAEQRERRHVKLGATFYGPDDWWRDYLEPPPPEPDPALSAGAVAYTTPPVPSW